MRIRYVIDAPDAEWDLVWRGCDYATYFHSREWAAAWARSTHGRTKPNARLVEFDDGKRAIIPLSETKLAGGLFARATSSPAGTYGGWLSVDGLSPEHGRRLTSHVLNQYPTLHWRLNPFDRNKPRLRFRDDVTDDETHVLNLTAGFDAVFKRWSKGHRAASRQSTRLGTTVRLATALRDWQAYFAVYQDSIRRWGDSATAAHGWGLFEAIFEADSEHVKLWLAERDDQIIAGALCFYARQHVVYWHGAALTAHFRSRPANLLMHVAIQDACDRGYKWFDFNPSGGLQGVRNFKRSFGALPMQCPFVDAKSLVVGSLYNLRTALGTLGPKS